MNRIIGEAREGAFATIEKYLDLIRSRILFDAVEDVGGFFSI